MSRYNLIQNPSFVSNVSYWGATGGSTVTWIDTDGFFGTTCAQIVKSSSADSGLASATSLAPVTPGTYYAISAYVKIPAGNEAGLYGLSWKWYTDTAMTTQVGSLDYGTTPPAYITDLDGWVRLTSITTAPVGAYGLRVYITQQDSSAAGQIFLADAVLVEATTASVEDPFGEYFINLDTGQKKTVTNRALRPVPFPEITGMQLNADISLNGLVLNTVDENGVVWVCTDIDGWWGLPNASIQDLPRGLGDGSYDVNGRYEARQLELSGVFLPPDSSYVGTARDTLVKAIDLVRKKGLLLTHENPTKGTYVRLSGQPTIHTVNARGRTEFSIGLKAANPIRYKWNQGDPDGYTTTTVVANGASPVSVVVTNEGNTTVPMLLTVNGLLTAGATITNATMGETITIAKTLATTNKQIGTVFAATSTWANNVDTVTVSINSTYQVAPGDEIIIASPTGTIVDGNAHIVTAVKIVNDSTINVTYTKYNGTSHGPLSSTTETGAMQLVNAETLTVDTYTRSVLLNSNIYGDRSYIDTYTDWITLQPGDNTITVTGTGVLDHGKVQIDYRSGWIG